MGKRIKRKRGEVLLSDGYQYHKHKVYANKNIIWFCSQRRKHKCTGSVTTAKIVLLVNGWLLAKGSPVAMLQHATSSQSIVFHTGLSDTSTAVPNPSSERHGTSQPKYEYKYEVSDQQTGDRKSHWESRDGDRVRGVYTLYEPDGALRTVEYTADATHGFNAVVKRNEPSKHQFPGQDSFSHSSSKGHYHNSSPSNQKPDRSAFSSIPPNRDDSDYSGSKSLYNSGVDFSVSHVLKKFRDADNLY